MDGILLVFHHPLRASAPTVMEHVRAFRQHSRFPVWAVNTELGFPGGLADLRFSIVVLHYSLFGQHPYEIPAAFLDYLSASGRDSYKIAFFHDEHRHCRARFAFLEAHRVNCVYTLLAPALHDAVYGRYTRVPKVITTIPGFVSDELISAARELTQPDEDRPIDIGYRGRRLDDTMGRAGREKSEIADGFLRRAAGLPLRLDIATDEASRIYGKKWWRFVASCRGILGVEAGVSIFDLEDRVRLEYERLERAGRQGELPRDLIAAWEDRIPYRTIGPRNFEAAALRVCQILFEGEYAQVMRAGDHYLPLRKDFSNFGEVLRSFGDPIVRRETAERAFADLIDSGRYSYRSFIAAFDDELQREGFAANPGGGQSPDVTRQLTRGLWRGKAAARVRALRNTPFPGRRRLKRLLGR